MLALQKQIEKSCVGWFKFVCVLCTSDKTQQNFNLNFNNVSAATIE